MTTASGVIAAMEVRDLAHGGTKTPPLGSTSVSNSPERDSIIASVYAANPKLFNQQTPDLTKKDVSVLDTALDALKAISDEIEAQTEQEFIHDIAREIKSMDQKDTHTIERTFNKQTVVIVVGPKAHEHTGEYACGKGAKKSVLGSYAIFGKSSDLREFVQKIFLALPEAFKQVQPSKVSTTVEAPYVQKLVPAPKAKKSLLERIFCCFLCCFGKRK
ncbi:MAG: hypothetical protein JSS10_03330 [Verrucomicrobia bacterium]|nr:hypothetical protein [Verrucomicrobiota bacterium]